VVQTDGNGKDSKTRHACYVGVKTPMSTA